MKESKAMRAAVTAAMTVMPVVTGMPIWLWLAAFCPGWAGWIFWPIYAALCLSLPMSHRLPAGKLRCFVHSVGECWMGVLMYSTMGMFTAAFAYLAGLLFDFLSHSAQGMFWFGLGGMGLSAVLYLAAFLNAFRLKKTVYTLQTEKPVEMDVALISDLHLGFTTGRRMLPRIVNKVNALQPDAVLVAGDLFDAGYDALRRPEQAADALAGLKSACGTYFCQGNHDLISPDPRVTAFCQRAGLRLLRDETVEVGEGLITGRLDKVNACRAEIEALPLDPADERYHIVLDHHPDDIEALWQAGADLVCCGHTHAGQTFPFTLVLRLMQKYCYGLFGSGSRHAVVTSGAGFWGPPLRLGARNEVVLIRIRQKK